MATRILVVDDSVAFRDSVRLVLETHRQWEVCGEAADGTEGVSQNSRLQPNIILMDFSMPGMSGIQAASAILKEFPKVPILLLTLHITRQLAQTARKIGIRGTISKTASTGLLDSIDAILRGEEFPLLANNGLEVPA